MERENNDFVHEEEGLGTALHNLPIPLNEINELPIESVHGLTDGSRESIEDSKLLFEDSKGFDVLSHNKSIGGSSSSTTTSIASPNRTPIRSALTTQSHCHAPLRPRNKRERPREQFLKTAKRLFDSEFDVADKSCSHCDTRKTPMWREGPKGAKTLCNACGVRYKTGRLYPEYRPASSPDFKPNVHSNFHREVMEIRKEKSCSHCGTTKILMWRDGPRGAKTLCNACGVRYKTNRLYPEFRPASSPDFKPSIHSNFHREAMEIRQEKSCSHCGTRETPMWREGPRGAKTLCNACGVRYKTGRLYPEYRPASSPDFNPDAHSNFHRKVMEIRREKN